MDAQLAETFWGIKNMYFKDPTCNVHSMPQGVFFIELGGGGGAGWMGMGRKGRQTTIYLQFK
jgi:hypothetical protein